MLAKIHENIFEEIANWICETGMERTTNGQHYIDFTEIATQFNVSIDWIKVNTSQIEPYLHSFLDYNIDDESFDMNFEGNECCKRCGNYCSRSKGNCSGCELWFDEYE